MSAAQRFAIAGEDDAPHGFFCPLTLRVMNDPVCIPGGKSYERAALMEYVAGRQGVECDDPMSQLQESDVHPNRNLRSVIEEWRERAKRGRREPVESAPVAFQPEEDPVAFQPEVAVVAVEAPVAVSQMREVSTRCLHRQRALKRRRDPENLSAQLDQGEYLSKLDFARLVRWIFVPYNTDYAYQDSALRALQEATEANRAAQTTSSTAYLEDLIRHTVIYSEHGRYLTIIHRNVLRALDFKSRNGGLLIPN
ncbi:hypothetical protein B484DRAFT_78419 [Ochromonadaceae sp. CCMP2298]|nr:hypothetical protein B484DRAFT_78419 [Ochromonadaceae sp. CCMP2298]